METEKVQKAVDSLRGDLDRWKGGLVKVFPDQLRVVLDALSEGVLVIPADEPEPEFAIGSRVELALDIEYFGVRYPAGTKGFVVEIDESGEYRYKVQFDDPLHRVGYEYRVIESQNFAAEELKVIA